MTGERCRRWVWAITVWSNDHIGSGGIPGLLLFEDEAQAWAAFAREVAEYLADVERPIRDEAVGPVETEGGEVVGADGFMFTLPDYDQTWHIGQVCLAAASAAARGEAQL